MIPRHVGISLGLITWVIAFSIGLTWFIVHEVSKINLTEVVLLKDDEVVSASGNGFEGVNILVKRPNGEYEIRSYKHRGANVVSRVRIRR